MSKLLIIRFSALGDVAMSIPVICSLAECYPDLDITVLSRNSYEKLFSFMPRNVHFHGADLKGKHRGLMGLHRLYCEELKPMNFDYVADFHWVLRSMLFDVRFMCSGVPLTHIRKGRSEKKMLTRRHHKVMKPQLASYERYRETLKELGFDFPMKFVSLFGEGKGDWSRMSGFITPKGAETWIGVAPFAKHPGKIYPLEHMKQVVIHFASCPGTKVFLFGAGSQEQDILEGWQKESPSSIYVTSGRLKMDTELILMSHLDTMVTMDSANMHFASLVNIPVVSVWGATHPYCGFLGYGQKEENCVQMDLDCRPCSVFGNKPCFREDYACMNQLPFEQIIHQVEQVVKNRS